MKKNLGDSCEQMAKGSICTRFATQRFGGDGVLFVSNGGSGNLGVVLGSVLVAGASRSLETGEGGGGGKSGVEIEPPGIIPRVDEPSPVPEPGARSSGKFGSLWLPKGGNVTLLGV